MAERLDRIGGIGEGHILLPKLHRRRSILPWSRLKVNRSIRRAAARTPGYYLTVNAAFDAVVAGCHAQHGENWLYPPIIAVLKSIQAQNKAGGDGQHAPAVCVQTFELWAGSPPPTATNEEESYECRYSVGQRVEVHGLRGTPEHNGKRGVVSSYNAAKGRYTVILDEGERNLGLRPVNLRFSPMDAKTAGTDPGAGVMPAKVHESLVAGEIGVAIGSCYLALTGFRRPGSRGAGGVQMVCLTPWKICDSY